MAEVLGNREGQTLIDDKQQFPLSHQSRGMASEWREMEGRSTACISLVLGWAGPKADGF